ncbi:MAG: polysulfide reductase NrfD [Desulforhopalus sp.]|nr:polysulfide reductase NrfD [Desulforhopalus sp.]
MEKIIFAGVLINRITLKHLLLNKTLLFGYFLLVLALVGTYQILDIRYFSAAINAHSAGLDPTNPALKEAMRAALSGPVGEVDRTVPWSLLIANYMYMIYTGSGVIFLVALAELLNFHVVARAAGGFMMAGIAMVFAGLFTIATDLNLLNMHWMLLSPNVKTGIWLMLPLYCFYIPFVFFEIYLILTNKREWAKRLALPILLLSIVVDVVEYYIQARLFSMNTARQLWTEFPVLTLYFIISAFVSSLGVMGVLSYFVHRYIPEYRALMALVRKAMLFFIVALGAYEVLGYLTVDDRWVDVILFGPLRTAYFTGYIFLTLALPFVLLIASAKPIFTVFASCCVLLGGFIGRCIFVYGGNAYPMSNRSGTGFEKYDQYAMANSFSYVSPHFSEILIVLGSIGVAMIIYKLFDGLFSVGELREHP